MSLKKNISVVAGLAALVAVSYIGFGAYNKEGTALAQSDKASSSNVDLGSDQAKLGYTIGTQIGRDLVQGGMMRDIEVNALVAALRDATSGAAAKMSDEEMLAAQQAFQVKRQEEYATLASNNKAAGEAFLESNKAAEGIQTTATGVQYEVVREGKGAQPSATDTVRVHYLGSLIDGTPFDSSYSRNEPADFPVNGVIPGFAEGLQLMKEGAKYRFVIPSALAYAEQAPESIGPNQVLIFEVELLEVLTKGE